MGGTVTSVPNEPCNQVKCELTLCDFQVLFPVRMKQNEAGLGIAATSNATVRILRKIATNWMVPARQAVTRTGSAGDVSTVSISKLKEY